MRILWICNIMLPVIAEHLKQEASNKEGWLSGLCSVILQKQEENRIELHVAFPAAKELDGCQGMITVEGSSLFYYGFYEDLSHAEKYDPELENRLSHILEQVKPHVIHCFGTEFGHALAAARCCGEPEKMLVGIQGICTVIAQAYMADLPDKVQQKVTFRDWLKKDSIREQQRKYEARGKREQEIISLVGNIAGRTEFDRFYAAEWNRSAKYFTLNETLRPCFYEGRWSRQACEPHTIFISQADYPLKGLHYLLLAGAKLAEHYPDLQIRVAGNSLVNYDTIKDRIKISAYGKYLRSLIQDNHLAERVSFLGKLTALQMKEEYLKCGLFVCCSANENSPNSLGEAMLLGVPCVATDVGGIPSMFRGDEDGILYQGYHSQEIKFDNMRNLKNSTLQQNVRNLYNAIQKVWQYDKITDDICTNARLHAEKTHDKEQNYAKMIEIYSFIAGQ